MDILDGKKRNSFVSNHSGKNRSIGKRNSYDSGCSRISINYNENGIKTGGMRKSMEFSPNQRSQKIKIG